MEIMQLYLQLSYNLIFPFMVFTQNLANCRYHITLQKACFVMYVFLLYIG